MTRPNLSKIGLRWERRNKRLLANLNNIQRMLDDGYSYSQIGRAINVDRKLIGQFCEEYRMMPHPQLTFQRITMKDITNGLVMEGQTYYLKKQNCKPYLMIPVPDALATMKYIAELELEIQQLKEES